MQFKPRNIRAIAEIVIGNADHFPYCSSSFITEFFQECDLEFVHDGSTRWAWAASRLEELLAESQPAAHALPERFMTMLRTRMPACCMEVGGTVGSATVPAARVLSPCRTRPIPAAAIHIPRPKRRMTNWAAYDAALRRRGSLTVWVTDEAIASWRAAPRTTPGASHTTRPWRSRRR